MTSTPCSPALAHSAPALSRGLVLLLATGAGLSVATLYYSQPMLGVLGADIQAGERAVGMVPMLTQLGYALGILLLAPLGDRYDRRRIILAKAGMLMLALLLSSIAPGVGALLVASLAIGLAATMAPESERGTVVGTVMTGLLLGILLSRVMSGLIAEQFGWRAVYGVAAISIALFAIGAWRGLPRFAATTSLGYGALLGSMLKLWSRYPALRRAALAQGLLSVAFSAFWSTLAVMLHARFGLGSAAAGAFGLAGAAGALAAPLAGRLADRRGPEGVTRLGAALTLGSFALLGLVEALPFEAQLGLIVVAAIGFDFAIQATLVAHQTIVYGIDPPARSRLNAVLFTGVFVGMASGAGLGSMALAQWGWSGVVALAIVASCGALLVRLLPASRP